jgi:hypothetical protein
LPLGERNSRFEQSLKQQRAGLMLSQTIAADGPTVFRRAEKLASRASYPSGWTRLILATEPSIGSRSNPHNIGGEMTPAAYT